jgi:hypothetical protein
MVCVKKFLRERMNEYTISRLKDSGVNLLRELAQDCLRFTDPKFGEIDLYLNYSTEDSNSLAELQKSKIKNGQNISNLFYKDGSTFFVPLTPLEKIKFRHSMSRYPRDQLYHMVNLRKKEANVLNLQSVKTLTYYQPDNHLDGGRLNEGIITFDFNPTIPDYDHISSEKPGAYEIMQRNGESLKRRALSSNKKSIDVSLGFIPADFRKRVFLLSESPNGKPVNIHEQMQGESLSEFLRQTNTNLEDWGGFDDIQRYINPN